MKRFATFLRYCSVSAIATTTSMVVLGLLVGTRAVTAGWANVVATAVGTVPSFELNRRWVWGKKGRRSLAAEIVPFCVLSFGGLALSTFLVHEAASWADTAGLTDTARTIAAEIANVGAFGTLWIVQFVVLDRVLFRHRPSPVTSPDVADLTPCGGPRGATERAA